MEQEAILQIAKMDLAEGAWAQYRATYGRPTADNGVSSGLLTWTMLPETVKKAFVAGIEYVVLRFSGEWSKADRENKILKKKVADLEGQLDYFKAGAEEALKNPVDPNKKALEVVQRIRRLNNKWHHCGSPPQAEIYISEELIAIENDLSKNIPLIR